MIVPMRRVTLLCIAHDRDAVIDELARLGVVHVVPSMPPDSSELAALRERITAYERALRALGKWRGAPANELAPDAVVAEVVALEREAAEARERAVALRAEQRRVAPFGEFDPNGIRQLAEAGLHVRLYRVARRQAVVPPTGAVLHELGCSREGRVVALVSLDNARLDLEELAPPDRPLSAIGVEIARLSTIQRANADRIAALGSHGLAVQGALADLRRCARLLEARDGMKLAEPIACLSGYAPVDSEQRIHDLARRIGCAASFADPGAEDEVPTLIRNPRWVRPIESVFAMTGILPGYREPDVSAVFLVFLSVFFAMLVGDAGYGILFVVLTLLARPLMRGVPRIVWSLLLLMSGTTIAWGVASGTWFGNTVAFRIAWLDEPSHVMSICFVIGAVHLTIAHVWAAIRCGRSSQAIAQLGWVATTWTMCFVAHALVLGDRFSPAVIWLFIAGVAAIVLFMTPRRALRSEWFNHVMLPLSLVSNFVDVVSYLRLFAVGTAGFQVAKAFNEMALKGEHSLVTGAAAACILLFGHALNVLLCAMGVLVHGVRLNTLEFSAHMGMQWIGVPYSPLTRPDR